MSSKGDAWYSFHGMKAMSRSMCSSSLRVSYGHAYANPVASHMAESERCSRCGIVLEAQEGFSFSERQD